MNGERDQHELPSDWEMARIDEVTHFSPKREAVEANEQDPFTFVPMSAVGEEFAGIDTSQTRPFAEIKKGYTQFKPGDVLSAKITPCMENGKIAVVPPLRNSHGYGSTEFTVLRPKDGVEAKWVAYYLFRQQFRSDAQRAMTGSAGQLRVPKKWLAEQQIPVAPHHQQQRIVAKIEELFSDLDAGVAAIQRVQANLKRYRASVLKAAVEGRLTQQWRAEHPDTSGGEPADELLQHILRQRREKWEQDQLAKYEAKGKNPPKNWQTKYKEPAAPDTTHLPELPQGWCWATLSQIGILDRGRSRHRPRNAQHLYGGPYPFVQTGDIRHADTFIREYDQTYTEAGLTQSKLWPANTLCITIAANIAETAILGFEGCFPDSVVGWLPASDDVSVRYVELFIRTMQARLEALAPATAQKNINLNTLQQVAIALPPRDEQIAIVNAAEQELSKERHLAQTADASMRRTAALRQAILKRAFEGALGRLSIPIKRETREAPVA